MNEHDECDHEHNEEGWTVVEPPAWKFSLWDVAGIAMHVTSGILTACAQGASLMAQECAASANRARNTWDARQEEAERKRAQAAIGEDIRALIEGPDA